MKTPEMYIGALGSYLPPVVNHGEPTDDDMVGATVAGDLPAIEMALTATRSTLERWGGGTEDLDLLLYVDTYHTGPDGWCPHAYLQRHAVGGHVLAARVDSGCNGMFSALSLGAAHLKSQEEPRSAMLVSACNVGSPLFNRWTSLPGFFMADAASALVLTRRPGFARLHSVAFRTVPELEELHRGDEPLYPPGVVTGRPVDFGARIEAFAELNMFTPEKAARLHGALSDAVQQALDEAEISVGDVTRIVTTTEPRAKMEERIKLLGLTPEQGTWWYSRTVGHSASDQWLAFEHLLREGELKPGDHLLMVGIGPGITFAAAIVEIVGEPSWLAAQPAGQLARKEPR